MEQVTSEKHKIYVKGLERAAAVMNSRDQAIVDKALWNYNQGLKEEQPRDFPSVMHSVLRNKGLALTPGLKFMLQASQFEWQTASEKSSIMVAKLSKEAAPARVASPAAFSPVLSVSAAEARGLMSVAGSVGAMLDCQSIYLCP